MTRRRLITGTSALAILIALFGVAISGGLTPKEQLGKSIFFDDDLSIHRNQACAACHAPVVGWTGPDEPINMHGSVYEGSIPGRFGDRKPPASAYATTSPILHLEKGIWVGGNFWDGRATGYRLGNPAADQAQGPFLNPAEQALPDAACVVYRVCTAAYPVSFEAVWGEDACDIVWPADVETACATEGGMVSLSPEARAKSNMNYDYIALSIAAYEASPEVNAFSSQFDFVRVDSMDKLSKQARRGFALFQGKGKCRNCHTSNGDRPLFTDYTYDNLGIPKNPENPIYLFDPGFIDYGLGAYLRSAGYPPEVWEPELGKQKVPTLRNTALAPSPEFVKAFAHNGYFKSLKDIVHFYNTRDVKPVCPGDYTAAQALSSNCWPPPEVSQNLNTAELGNLGLSPDEEDAIVEFLKTLSDGYVPTP
jgi:cytochrome c peroxidase